MLKKELKPAISIVFRDGNTVLVLKRSLFKETFPGAWSLPSTYVNGENVAVAANRLVKRKLLIDEVVLKPDFIGVSPIVEKDTFFLHMTDYEVDSFKGEISFDKDEYVEMRWVTPVELLDLITTENHGEIGECTRTFLISEGLL